MIHEMCRSARFRKNRSTYVRGIQYHNESSLCRINANPLRMEPYIPAFFKTNSLFASDIGIDINQDAHIIIAPNIGSYVGGDITAGTLSA